MLQASIRAGRLVLGLALMIGGGVLALPGVPGPGLLLVVGGLTLLGSEFQWAQQANEWLREQGRRMIGRSDG